MNYYEPATFENVQVTTGAGDISMGTSGMLINMVTRRARNGSAASQLDLPGQEDTVGQR